jgi:hypothetical protein
MQIFELIFAHRIQVFSICGSALLFYFIISLIKRRRLKEEYAILWIFTAAVFIFLSIFTSILEFLAHVAGVSYAPAALMLLLILSITVILIHYSTVISKLSRQNKLLAQELALLKHEIQKGIKK